jgi:hypothetical protein
MSFVSRRGEIEPLTSSLLMTSSTKDSFFAEMGF